MPPYQQVGSSSYYSDDDEDADSAYTATGKDKEEEEAFNDVKEKAVLREVRFAPEDQNRVHVYPGVSTEEHHLVWYTEAEEDAFVVESSLLHSTSSSASSCHSVSSLVALMLRCDCRDDHNDDKDGEQVQQQVQEGEPKVLSTALLLGSLVVQGVVLRAVLLGHEIREIAAQQQQQQQQQSRAAQQIHDDLTFFCL